RTFGFGSSVRNSRLLRPGSCLPIDQHEDNGSEDRQNPSPQAGVDHIDGHSFGIVEQAGDEAAENRTADAEEDRGYPTHRVPPRNQQPRDGSDDQAHDDRPDDSHGPSSLSAHSGISLIDN